MQQNRINKREQEIKDLITEQKMDILYLVETDTSAISEEMDYKLQGFKTYFHLSFFIVSYMNALTPYIIIDVFFSHL